MIKLLSQRSTRLAADLRRALQLAPSRFEMYRQIFEECGITEANLEKDDPFYLLSQLPVLDSDGLDALSADCLLNSNRIIDMETSSGTTGARKRRFISDADDAAETELLCDMFRMCGVGEGDRVACLDTDPLTLMASFTRAFDAIGVDESYALCVGTDFEATLEVLPFLDPTVIVGVPSVIQRCLNALLENYAGVWDSHQLETLIYVGEPMPESLRRTLVTELDLKVFGYYGASETSALGIECRSSLGIHLFTNHNVIEVERVNDLESVDEIFVTSLHQPTFPLIRYALGDLISVYRGDCVCGIGLPCVDVLARKGEYFSVLGAKMYYNPIQKACVDAVGFDHPMQVILSNERYERLTIVMPSKFREQEPLVKKTLLAQQPDLDYLVGARYLALNFRFENEPYFSESRKFLRMVDLRKRA